MCNFSTEVITRFITRWLQCETIFHRFMFALFRPADSSVSTESYTETCRITYKFCYPQMAMLVTLIIQNPD